MDLKDRKFIKNTKPSLPKYEGGFDEKIAMGASGLLSMLGQIANATRSGVTAEGLLGTSRRSTGNFDGFEYDVYSPIDSSSAASQVSAQNTGNIFSLMGSGAAIGGAVAGVPGIIGGVIPGLVGGLAAADQASSDFERQKREAERKLSIKQDRSLFTAQNKAMLNNYAKNFGNLDSLQLTQAEEGLEPSVNPYTRETYDKYKVQTIDGEDWDTANALGAPNEFIVRGNKYKRIHGTPGDTNLLNIDMKRDGIISNKDSFKNPETGHKLSQDVPLYSALKRLPDLLYYQAMQKNGLMKAKCGYLPKYDLGLENIIPAIFNTGVGIHQILASKDKMSSPQSYFGNEYATNALRNLHSYRVNTLPIYNEARAAQARTNDALVRSGGLSAGQLGAALLASERNTLANNAKTLTDAQLQNIKLSSEADMADINVGAQNAARKQSAYQWDYDKEAAAHNAMVQAWNTGAQNISEAVANYIKMNWERNKFQQIMDLYHKDAEIKNLRSKGGYNGTTWSLKGDYTPQQTFEKYAPTPFKSIKDVWAPKPKSAPFNPIPNVNVPFASMEQAMLKQLKKKRR